MYARYTTDVVSQSVLIDYLYYCISRLDISRLNCCQHRTEYRPTGCHTVASVRRVSITLEILEISLNLYGPPVDDRLHWFPVMIKLGTGSLI